MSTLSRTHPRPPRLHTPCLHAPPSSQDLRLWAPLVREGGAILLDDYLGVWSGVRQAADEFAAQWGLRVEANGHKGVLRRREGARWPKVAEGTRYYRRKCHALALGRALTRLVNRTTV